MFYRKYTKYRKTDIFLVKWEAIALPSPSIPGLGVGWAHVAMAIILYRKNMNKYNY